MPEATSELRRIERAYDTTQMAYRLRDQEIAYYRDHEWAATPSEMMQPLIVDAIAMTPSVSQRDERNAGRMVAPGGEVGRRDSGPWKLRAPGARVRYVE